MTKNPSTQIQERIAAAPDGTVFVRPDFADVAGPDAIQKVLRKAVRTGTLYRVLRGVYAKPEYSNYLQEYIAADPEAVAHAIARKNNWTIGPSRNAALNRLGLSTQVPVGWFFASDGLSRTYSWDNTTLLFEHENQKGHHWEGSYHHSGSPGAESSGTAAHHGADDPDHPEPSLSRM